MAGKALAASRRAIPSPVLNVNLRFFAVPLFYALLVSAPLARGLFFAADRVPFHMASASLFLLVLLDKLNRRDMQFAVSWMDYVVLGLAACYGLSFLVAVDKLAALYSVLTYVNYFMLYWVTASLCRERKYPVQVLRVLFVSGLVVVLVGLGAAMELIPFPGAFGGGRLMSTLQYPNALAALAMATGLVCLGLWAHDDSMFWKLAYASGNFLFIVTILGTYTRGVWVLYPLGVVLLVLGLKGERLWRLSFGYLWGLAACLMVVRPLMTMIAAQQGPGIARQLAIGLGLVLAGQLGYDLVLAALKRYRVHRRTRRLVLVGMVVYLVITGGAYLVYVSGAWVSAAAQLLPGGVVERAEAITLDAQSATMRLITTQDALKIVRTRPLLGAGGGGWNALYHQHQTVLYWMTETHNHFAQLWVEVGTLGFVFYLGFWAGLLYLGYRLLRSPEERAPAPAWTAVAAASAYGLHSAIDFHLSLPGAALFLWVLAGVAVGSARHLLPLLSWPPEAKLSQRVRRVVQFGGTGLLAVAVFVLSARVNAAGHTGARAAVALHRHHFQWARDLYQEAIRLNPFSAAYHADLAHTYTALGILRGRGEELERAAEHMQRARHLQGHDVELRQRLADIYLLKHNWAAALEERRTMVALVPLELGSYEIYATMVIQLVPHLVGGGQIDTALEHLDAVVAFEDQLRKRRAVIPQHLQEHWPPRHLLPTTLLQLRWGQARYLLGEWEESAARLAATSGDRHLREESELWRAAARAQLGRGDESARILLGLSTTAVASFPEVMVLGQVLAEANGQRRGKDAGR
jgi:O-antigen ligase